MTYYLTAVKYSSNGSNITHGLLHSPAIDNGRLQKGTIKTKVEIMTLIRNGNSIITAVFNYGDSLWKIGAEIGISRNGSTVYLRTNADSTVIDNLGNLLLIDELM